MSIRQQLERAIEEMNEEQLALLLNFTIYIKHKEKAAVPMVQSQAYQEWLSAENDIYI
jgi:hypothetical protein